MPSVSGQATTNEGSAGRWICACSVADLSVEAGRRVELEGVAAVAIFKLDDGIFAIADLCSHGAASLSEGIVEKGVIECPFHSGTFDIKTGQPLTFPCTEAVGSYPVRVVGDDVQVLVAEPER